MRRSPQASAERPRTQLGFIAVRDRDCCSHITETLRHAGWRLVAFASGYHIVEALAEVITGDVIGLRPDLIVVDAISPGCSGMTIAAGFRDLGIEIPMILIAPSKASDVASGECVGGAIVVDPALASSALVTIAGLRSGRAKEYPEDRRRQVG